MTCIPSENKMTLLTGAPGNPAERLEKEQRCYALLQSLEIPFFRVDHEPAYTIEACHTVETVLGCEICKNLLLTNRQGTAFYMLLMPGDKVFKTKYLSAALGCARLSFAPGEKMEELLDITPGSLSVLGLMNDPEHRVQLVIDAPVLEAEWLGCHPCINTSTLRFSVKALTEKLLPAMGHAPTVVRLPEEPEEP